MKNHWEEKTARVIMVFVGLFCIFLSIYYSTQFYITEFKRPLYIAIIMSSVIGMFNAFSLVAASFLIRAKKYFLAGVFIPLMLFSVSFDIMTVVGAQSISYSAKKAEQAIEMQLEEADSIEGQLLKDELDMYSSQLQTTREMLIAANSRLGPIRSRYDQASAEYEAAAVLVGTTDEEKARIETEKNAKARAMRSAQYDKNEVEKEIAQYQDEIKTLEIKLNGASDNYKKFVQQQSREASTEDYKENTQTFSQWLSSVVKFIPEEWLQFLLVLIPALFIDLISPIALNFGLTLIHEKEEKADINYYEEPEIAQPYVQPEPVIQQPLHHETQNKGLIIDRSDLEKNKFNTQSTINFRFGKTTQKVANTLSDFIDACVGDNPGPFIKSAEDAAKELKISNSAKDVFIKHLSNLAIDNKPLIFKDSTGYCHSNFSSDQIKKFAMEIVA